MSDPQVTFTVSDGYISLPVDTDPDTLVGDQLDAIAASFPGWVPQEGHLEVALLEAFAQMASETAQVAAQVPIAIFSYFGTLVGITQQAGLAATTTTTWTMVDNKGYTVPAGTIVGFQVTGTDLVLFETLADVTVAAGSTSTAAGAVTIQALDVGSAANGIAAGTVTLVDSLAFVASIASTAVTAGGVDPETQTAYLDRLSAELQSLAPRPILPADYANLAPQTVGVTRALAIDGLSPGRSVTDGVTTSGSPTVTSATAAFTSTDVGRSVAGTGIPANTYIGVVNSATSIGLSSSATSNVPINATATGTGVTLTFGDLTGQQRTIAVAGVDASGNALSSTVKSALQANLQAKREVNFVVNVIDPTYTSIDVSWSVASTTGSNTTTVQSAVNAALASFLSPANWAGGTASPPVWTSGVTVVRYLDVAAVIHAVAGVDHITSLTIGVHGGSMGSSDVTLTGNAPLPTAGTISGFAT